jgi:hypothetical protein
VVIGGKTVLARLLVELAPAGCSSSIGIACAAAARSRSSITPALFPYLDEKEAQITAFFQFRFISLLLFNQK